MLPSHTFNLKDFFYYGILQDLVISHGRLHFVGVCYIYLASFAVFWCTASCICTTLIASIIKIGGE